MDCGQWLNTEVMMLKVILVRLQKVELMLLKYVDTVSRWPGHTKSRLK